MTSQRRQLWIMALAASQMGFLVAGGLLGGLWLDRLWNSSPWMALLGLIGGFAVGIRLLIGLVRADRAAGKEDHGS